MLLELGLLDDFCENDRASSCWPKRRYSNLILTQKNIYLNLLKKSLYPPLGMHPD